MREMVTAQAATTQVLLQIQESLRNLAPPHQNVPPPEVNEGNNHNRLLNQFRKTNPPSFQGEYDPDIAEKWIRQIEKIFRVLDCTIE